MNEVLEYKGHQITADANKSGKGWRGSYQINGEEIHDCEDRPLPSADLALQQAIGEAKWRIDQMTK